MTRKGEKLSNTAPREIAASPSRAGSSREPFSSEPAFDIFSSSETDGARKPRLAA